MTMYKIFQGDKLYPEFGGFVHAQAAFYELDEDNPTFDHDKFYSSNHLYTYEDAVRMIEETPDWQKERWTYTIVEETA